MLRGPHGPRSHAGLRGTHTMQRVGGALAAVISDHGGAKTAVAGGSFCMVLSHDGTVSIAHTAEQAP